MIIEAMACGTPVAASRSGGPLEILEDGIDGLFHTPGDVEAMAVNVERLLYPDQAEKIRQKAYQKLKSRFTHEQYTNLLHAFVCSNT